MWESGFLGTLTAGSFATLAAILAKYLAMNLAHPFPRGQRPQHAHLARPDAEAGTGPGRGLERHRLGRLSAGHGAQSAQCGGNEAYPAGGPERCRGRPGPVHAGHRRQLCLQGGGGRPVRDCGAACHGSSAPKGLPALRHALFRPGRRLPGLRPERSIGVQLHHQNALGNACHAAVSGPGICRESGDTKERNRRKLRKVPKLKSRGNRALQTACADLLPALVFCHLQEHSSGRHLRQVLREAALSGNICPCPKKGALPTVPFRGDERARFRTMPAGCRSPAMAGTRHAPRQAPGIGRPVAIATPAHRRCSLHGRADCRQGGKQAKAHLGSAINSLPAWPPFYIFNRHKVQGMTGTPLSWFPYPNERAGAGGCD